MQLMQYLFNRDQAGDWDTLYLYFASHKPLQSLNPVLRRVCVCVPTSPTPLTTPRELPQAPVSTVTSIGIITAAGKHSARSVERWTICQYCYGFNINTETCCIQSTWWNWSCQCDTVTLTRTRRMLSRQRRARQKNHLSSATAMHSHSRWLAGPVAQLGWSITHTGCRK